MTRLLKTLGWIVVYLLSPVIIPVGFIVMTGISLCKPELLDPTIRDRRLLSPSEDPR